MKKRRIALLLMAAAMMSAPVNTVAPVPANAEYVANAEILPSELTDMLPEEETAAIAFANEYGTISVHSGYVVFCGKDSEDLPSELRYDVLGDMEFNEVYTHSCPYNWGELLPPGSSMYVVRVYKPTGSGAAKLHFYDYSRYPVNGEYQTADRGDIFVSVDDELKCTEISKMDFARLFLWEKNTFSMDTFGSTVSFYNNDSESQLDVIVTSNQRFTARTDGNSASFTALEDGTFVVTVENMVTWDMHDENGVGYDYVFPILSNFVMECKNGEVTSSCEGICNFYSQKQVEEMGEKYFGDDVTDPPANTTVYFKDIEDYLRGGAYYAFVNTYIKGENSDYNNVKAYISNIYRPDETISQFFVNTRGYNRNDWSVTNAYCTEFMGTGTTASGCDGNLKNPSPDEIDLHIFRGFYDGETTITVGERSFDLVVKDGIFSYPLPDPTEDIEVELPKTRDEYMEFVEKYGKVSTHGKYMVICDSQVNGMGGHTEISTVGQGIFEEVKTITILDDSDLDGTSTRYVRVFVGVEPGVCRLEGDQVFEWSDKCYVAFTEFLKIDEDMSISKITYEDYINGIMNDPRFTNELKAILPRTVEMHRAFVQKYGSASNHGQYMIFCDDSDNEAGVKLVFDQEGEGEFEAVMTYDVQSDNETHTVIVYKAVTPGAVMATWKYIDIAGKIIGEESVSYYGIGDDLSVTEITEDEFSPVVTGDANGDGVFTIADMAVVGKWLVGKSDELPNPKAVDLCKDGKIDVYDYTLLRKEVVKALDTSNLK